MKFFKFPGKLFILLFFLTAASCNDPLPSENWGDMLLSSAFDFTTSSVVGYNFEFKSYPNFPSTEGSVPDIILDKFTKPDGKIFPGFSSPANDAGFALVSESGSLVQALEFFNAYEEFNTSASLSSTSDTIRLYQVWILKTSMDNYVKMLVKDIFYLTNLSGDYIKVNLEYYYQDDGTALFAKR